MAGQKPTHTANDARLKTETLTFPYPNGYGSARLSGPAGHCNRPVADGAGGA